MSDSLYFSNYIVPRKRFDYDWWWNSNVESYDDNEWIVDNEKVTHGRYVRNFYYNLKKIVNERNIYKPSEILQHLTEHVISSIIETKDGEEVKDGMDIALCSIQKDKMKLDYSGAYNPLYHISDGHLEIVKGDKFPIGAFVGETLQKFTNNVVSPIRG